MVGAGSGRFFSENGFKISLGESSWSKEAAPKSFKTIEVVFKSQQDLAGAPPASLTVRRDDLEKSMTLESYVKTWRKDYPRFGFDILNSQKVKVGPNVGFMLDLTHSQTKSQLRQVVFVKSTQAVILTCRDKRQTFRKSLKSCNKIIRTFNWTL